MVDLLNIFCAISEKAVYAPDSKTHLYSAIEFSNYLPLRGGHL